MGHENKAGAAGCFGENAAASAHTGSARETAKPPALHTSDCTAPKTAKARGGHEGFAIRADANVFDPYVRSLVDTVNDAIQWRECNPRCWSFMVARCRELTAAGRHFAFRMVIEEARYHAAPANGDGLFRLPNEYAPILQRMACANVPGMSALVSMRKSKFDEVLLD